MAKKKEEVIVEEVVATEVETVATEERDEEFYKKHTGAREDVIYG